MHRRRLIATAALACSLAACSSGSHGAATTTAPVSATTVAAPPAATRATVRAYFAGRGAKLLAFATTSSGLATGLTPTLATCKTIQTDLKKLPNAGELATIAVGIPDTYLAAHFRTAVFVRAGLLEACIKDQIIPTFVNQPFENAKQIRTRLAQFGLTL